MAWDEHPSGRRERLPDDWPLRRIRVLRRDGYRCQHRDAPGTPMCGAPANQVDHVERGDDHSLDNLRALCRRHHALKSSAEGNAAKPRRRREPEPHPGLIRT
jgi:5-methylcytosine-specific restriction enzyme A